MPHAPHHRDTRPSAPQPAHAGADTGDAVEFYGTIVDYWSHTQVRDWIMLHPQMTRTAYLLYSLLRSMVTEKRPGALRRMSLDQLCWLLPGINSKPTGLSTVKDALQVLARLGLVTNPDGRLVTSTGQGGIQTTLRRYQVHDLPPDAYDGWRNAWDKLDAYRPDWREHPPAPPARCGVDDPAERFEGRISGHRADLGRSGETPGGFDSRKSGGRGRKSGRASRNSGERKPVTSENAPPKEVSPRSSSLSLAPAASASAEVAGERENPAAGHDDAATQAAARIAQAWAQGMADGGGTRMPRRQAAIAAQALELLTAGEQDTDFLTARAQWMGRVKPTWQRFEDALTFEGHGAPPRRTPQPRAPRGPRCGQCDNGWRYQDPHNALGPYRCPDCATN
ncbi:hypothetical protein [Streptacidiphilus sp. EB129]|uniref:hypothetical protein n=1 Tax=Streptacidiphilus sp. EB129 TaxID=3156262 RepID=UPI0035130201